MKLAIIGSGIGGCSAAYFAKELIPENIEITIFEANEHIGGRVLSRNIGPVMVELGGTFFHTINLNFIDLVQKFSFEAEEFVLPIIGVWDGSEFIYKSSKSRLITTVRLFFRYRMSAINLLNFLNKGKKEVLNIYESDRLNHAHNTLEELIDSPFILDASSKTLETILLENGVSHKLIQDLIEPGTRYIYHQDIDIGGFAGIATLIASDGSPIYKLRKGNIYLLETLIKSANAQLKVNHRIKKITKNELEKFTLSSTQGSFDEFDAVILAAPIEQLSIEFENITLPTIEPREYRKVYMKLITGFINPQFFGLKNISEVPQLLLTTSEFTGLFDNLETLGKTEDGHFVYNLFATNPIPSDLVNDMFSNCIIEEDYVWEFAYPVTRPITTFQPIIFDSMLYYINTLESLASTMETTILASKNVVLLLKKMLSESTKV